MLLPLLKMTSARAFAWYGASVGLAYVVKMSVLSWVVNTARTRTGIA